MNPVQDFAIGDCRFREVKLADGMHGPIILRVDLSSQKAMRAIWSGEESPGLHIRYRGHKADLIALGCLDGTPRHYGYGCSAKDPRGARVWLDSSAGPGVRGRVDVTYQTQTRLFAATLPGVMEYCADWVGTLTGRPPLRLVIDNTRQI